MRHGGSEFRPDQSVTDRNDSSEQPAKHGVRSTHTGEHQRDGEKRSYTDHFEHVRRGRFEEAQTANKVGAFLFRQSRYV